MSITATKTKTKKIAIIGNPNCGKTTLFNGLTGSTQRVGNWPGVTVEKKEGLLKKDNQELQIIDLPGIYSLSASSEDEVVARDYILSGEADCIVNIIDATNLERNMYLLTQLLEMNVQLIVVLNMMDMAKEKGLKIDTAHLSEHLGCLVVPMSATEGKDVDSFAAFLAKSVENITTNPAKIHYLDEIETGIEELSPQLERVSSDLGVTPRWTAIKIFEGDTHITQRALRTEDVTMDEIDAVKTRISGILEEDLDVLIADNKYAFIQGIVKDTTQKRKNKAAFSRKVDSVVMNRFLGIPIFLGVMYLVFWTTTHVGGAFIDFFDIFFGTIFVDGFATLLSSIGAPEWVIALLAHGIGAGIQTIATFVPIIFMMFFMLSLLEDSGYMARAAFVMDRFLRAIGLPGKAFVPMLIGFGCTVPAMMATRTLEERKDRLMTMFMTPFMSCGARLPVYALFAAAFFPALSGTIVFSLYIVGILLAVLTGVLLKNTLFKGETSHFIMELPPYHAPRIKHILIHAGNRLKSFAIRAGKVITLAVMVLGFLNSLGTDGQTWSFGNEDSETSVLAHIGKTITPIFTPMGVEEDNWPATVGLFTGIFAKEAVVGTLNSLYSQNNALSAEETTEEEDAFDFWAGISEAFATIPDNLSGVLGGLTDPLGIGMISDDEEAVAQEVGADKEVFALMRENYTSQGAYAYLLFILIYFPCVAAFGAAMREMGKKLGWLLVSYLTVLGWIVATLYYQISSGIMDPLWIAVPVALLGVTIVIFKLMGRSMNWDKQLETPIPVKTTSNSTDCC